MEKLFEDSELFQLERPSKISEEQERQVYVDIANDIRKLGYSDDAGSTIVEDIKNISFNDCGFDIAKELSEDGYAEYTFNGDFIDFLDTLTFRKYDVIQGMVAQWVTAHNIKPNLKVGTKLKLKINVGRTYKLDDIVYITGYDKYARYIINNEYPANGGTLIPYETIESNCEIINSNEQLS